MNANTERLLRANWQRHKTAMGDDWQTIRDDVATDLEHRAKEVGRAPLAEAILVMGMARADEKEAAKLILAVGYDIALRCRPMDSVELENAADLAPKGARQTPPASTTPPPPVGCQHPLCSPWRETSTPSKTPSTYVHPTR